VIIVVLVFDLDDTLYNEVMFVQSGFRAVAEFLYQAYAVPIQDSYSLMVEELKSGRGHIFNDILLHFKIFSEKTVEKCISIYRSHEPNIKLYDDAIECLRRFKNVPVYIVTDGNKLVQKNKLIALGLYDTVKFCFITHRYGVKNAKPSPHCFLKICKWEKVEPCEVVYIGDNPHKDFLGIKALGFKSVRIMRGHFKDVVKPEKFEADRKIQSLDELTMEFFDGLFVNTSSVDR
jgi:putative hydrolase of the HAD superfamily